MVLPLILLMRRFQYTSKSSIWRKAEEKPKMPRMLRDADALAISCLPFRHTERASPRV